MNAKKWPSKGSETFWLIARMSLKDLAISPVVYVVAKRVKVIKNDQ